MHASPLRINNKKLNYNRKNGKYFDKACFEFLLMNTLIQYGVKVKPCSVRMSILRTLRKHEKHIACRPCLESQAEKQNCLP
jgi:hypothetical protein